MFDPSKINFDENQGKNDNLPKKEEKEDILWSIDMNSEENNGENWRMSEEKSEENNGEDWIVAEKVKKDNVNSEETSKEIKEDNIKPREISEKSEEENSKEDNIKSEEKSKEVEETPDNWELTPSNWPLKTIFDVNIVSLRDVLSLLIDKEYDFATFEADDEKVKIVFRKDKVIVETKYIKYPVYSNILLKAKSLTKLDLSEINKEQEWKGEATIESKNYDILTKVVPSSFWEKLFLKAKESKNKEKQLKKEKKKKIGQLFSFLWAALFILLLVWGSFLSFIVLNARTVEDVKFFTSLGINLNQINSFIGSIVFITFSVLLLIMTIFLVIFLFKFILTKKDFRQKKVRYGIISALFFIMTFSTASAWKFVNDKINELPNWEYEALWEIQLYDNSKLKNEEFGKRWAFIEDTSNLIWPIDIEFDVWLLQKKEERRWFTIQKYIWDIWWEEFIETTSKIIHKFDKKGIYDISLKIIEKNRAWEVKEKNISNIPAVNINYLVKITKRPWKLYSLDASDLKPLWKAEWYSPENLETPIYEWYNYITWKPVIKEEIIWLYLRKEWKESTKLDKIFIISWEKKSNLSWEIEFKRDSIDDLKYSFSAKNLKVDEWAWTIEQFLWTIWNKEYFKDIKDIENKNENWDMEDVEKVSMITHSFKSYWEKDIKLEIIDSAWNKRELRQKIEIKKQMKLKSGLKIYADSKEISNTNYKPKLWDYYLNNLWIPTKLKFDARFIKSEDILYSLNKISWDYDWDGAIDHVWKEWKYDLVKTWSHNIKVYYEFKNRKLSDETIKIEENIYIEAVKKEAMIDFKIKKFSEYVPVKVWFDASKSSVKWKNISKFIWDYGDGIKEERDSIVPAHIYVKEWEYTVKLAIVTEDGSRYETSKNLILKPTAQTVKIKPSMKRAPVYQEIDFISSESSWDITWYSWDFGDGTTSIEANPSHMYAKSWKYKVKLTLYFRNRNVMEDSIEVEIIN